MLLKIRGHYVDLQHVRYISRPYSATIKGRIRICFDLNVGGTEVKLSYKDIEKAERVCALLAQFSGGPQVHQSFLDLRSELEAIEESE